MPLDQTQPAFEQGPGVDAQMAQLIQALVAAMMQSQQLGNQHELNILNRSAIPTVGPDQGKLGIPTKPHGLQAWYDMNPWAGTYQNPDWLQAQQQPQQSGSVNEPQVPLMDKLGGGDGLARMFGEGGGVNVPAPGVVEQPVFPVPMLPNWAPDNVSASPQAPQADEAAFNAQLEAFNNMFGGQQAAPQAGVGAQVQGPMFGQSNTGVDRTRSNNAYSELAAMQAGMRIPSEPFFPFTQQPGVPVENQAPYIGGGLGSFLGYEPQPTVGNVGLLQGLDNMIEGGARRGTRGFINLANWLRNSITGSNVPRLEHPPYMNPFYSR